MHLVDCTRGQPRFGSRLGDRDPRWPSSVDHALCSVLPAAARAVIDDGTGALETLPAVEQSFVRNAVATRQHEFALGRQCARAALAEFGVRSVTIPVGKDRAPLWPPGFVGSISHCRGFVGAVVAPSNELRGIGFDAEQSTPLPPELVRAVCTPAEIEWMAGAGPSPFGDWGKLLFAAKEAIHKCISPICGRMLDFTDVTLTVTAGGEFVASPASDEARDIAELPTIRGRIAAAPQFVFACAAIAARGS